MAVALVNSASITGATTPEGNLTVPPLDNSAGNLLVLFLVGRLDVPPAAVDISDTLDNTWYRANQLSTNLGWAAFYVAPNCKAGENTVTIGSLTAGFGGPSAFLFEVSASPGAGLCALQSSFDVFEEPDSITLEFASTAAFVQSMIFGIYNTGSSFSFEASAGASFWGQLNELGNTSVAVAVVLNDGSPITIQCNNGATPLTGDTFTAAIAINEG
jgi:hypothetical protein